MAIELKRLGLAVDLILVGILFAQERQIAWLFATEIYSVNAVAHLCNCMDGARMPNFSASYHFFD